MEFTPEQIEELRAKRAEEKEAKKAAKLKRQKRKEEMLKHYEVKVTAAGVGFESIWSFPLKKISQPPNTTP